ncbi:putative methyltransferase-domain-containing protein [Alternaria rosae]|uniref:putative methyltransferase-domain-containing protein n=1 Tax=Alternaria rosae TaxID=1187941 RepID=UPI001E8E7126|nr:putative methyltransferase-domain-containing protein [Alternaria rosae]KAH6842169.1 putative methyltransferase-domain-containing protein [Alternaria rosae]
MDAPSNLSQLRILQRQYFQLVEPHQLRWPDDAILKAPNVQAWLFHNLFDAANITSLPPGRYRLRILKQLVAKLERSITDPEEDQKAFVTYSYPDHLLDDSVTHERTVTLLEARSVISSSGTTGLRTWEAALLLGSHLASEAGRPFVSGKRVFELGAGTGMLSILCAKHLGAAGVVATDGDEAVVDAIKTNLFLNGLDVDDTSRIQVRTALRWGHPIDAAAFSEDYGMSVPDVVVGADVTYDKSVIPRLVSTLGEFFDLNPALEALISATIRNEQTFET